MIVARTPDVGSVGKGDGRARFQLNSQVKDLKFGVKNVCDQGHVRTPELPLPAQNDDVEELAVGFKRDRKPVETERPLHGFVRCARKLVMNERAAALSPTAQRDAAEGSARAAQRGTRNPCLTCWACRPLGPLGTGGTFGSRRPRRTRRSGRAGQCPREFESWRLTRDRVFFAVETDVGRRGGQEKPVVRFALEPALHRGCIVSFDESPGRRYWSRTGTRCGRRTVRLGHGGLRPPDLGGAEFDCAGRQHSARIEREHGTIQRGACRHGGVAGTGAMFDAMDLRAGSLARRSSRWVSFGPGWSLRRRKLSARNRGWRTETIQQGFLRSW